MAPDLDTYIAVVVAPPALRDAVADTLEAAWLPEDETPAWQIIYRDDVYGAVATAVVHQRSGEALTVCLPAEGLTGRNCQAVSALEQLSGVAVVVYTVTETTRGEAVALCDLPQALQAAWDDLQSTADPAAPAVQQSDPLMTLDSVVEEQVCGDLMQEEPPCAGEQSEPDAPPTDSPVADDVAARTENDRNDGLTEEEINALLG